MNAVLEATPASRYAKCIEVSKRVRWDIDADVLRGRDFDWHHKFMPDGLSRLDRVSGLERDELRLMTQIQGRTYAYLFGVCERFINAKVLELSSDHRFGDQLALEALVRFSDEEMKHQELFRRVERMIGAKMPPGYRYAAEANPLAEAVLAHSTWGVVALTNHIELFTQAHYRESIATDPELSPLFKDIFLFHWREEAQHAILDEMEWRRVHASCDAAARDRGVDDLIALVGAVDSMLVEQSALDVEYFQRINARKLPATELETLRLATLAAYRWQYIVSGAVEPRFAKLLGEMTTSVQMARIGAALGPIVAFVERH